MNWNEIINMIFQVCLIPLLGIITKYIVEWVKNQSEQFQKQNENQLLDKYIKLAEGTISQCVIATNQTYVDALKEAGGFGPEEQKIAFEKTFSAVMKILGDDAKHYLSFAFGDLEAYITSLIEAEVSVNK